MTLLSTVPNLSSIPMQFLLESRHLFSGLTYVERDEVGWRPEEQCLDIA